MPKNKDPRYKAAQKRVEELKSFYTHVSVYLSVIAMLALLDLVTGDGLDWVIYPALGWGVAVLIHASQVLVIERFFGEEWEERKIYELLGEKPKRGARLELAEAMLAEENDVPADEQVALRELLRTTPERQERSKRCR